MREIYRCRDWSLSGSWTEGDLLDFSSFTALDLVARAGRKEWEGEGGRGEQPKRHACVLLVPCGLWVWWWSLLTPWQLLTRAPVWCNNAGVSNRISSWSGILRAWTLGDVEANIRRLGKSSWASRTPPGGRRCVVAMTWRRDRQISLLFSASVKKIFFVWFHVIWEFQSILLAYFFFERIWSFLSLDFWRDLCGW